MKAIVSFVKAMVGRVLKRWLEAKLIMLLASLGLIAVLLLALKLIVDYVKTRLSDRPLQADLPLRDVVS